MARGLDDTVEGLVKRSANTDRYSLSATDSVHNAIYNRKSLIHRGTCHWGPTASGETAAHRHPPSRPGSRFRPTTNTLPPRHAVLHDTGNRIWMSLTPGAGMPSTCERLRPPCGTQPACHAGSGLVAWAGGAFRSPAHRPRQICPTRPLDGQAGESRWRRPERPPLGPRTPAPPRRARHEPARSLPRRHRFPPDPSGRWRSADV